MSFGFSAGDFVASILLIKDVVQALNTSKGSVAEVAALLSTLESLQHAIITSEVVYKECGLFDLDDAASLVAKTLRTSIEAERNRCHEILVPFIYSVKPHHDVFLRPGWSLIRQAKKITWLFREDDIAQVDRNLTKHLTAFQMFCQLLTQVHSQSILQTSSDILSKVIDLRAEVTSMSRVVQSLASIPSGIGNPWESSSALSDTVLLLDAIGRSVLLPMMLLGSVEDIHQLLVIMYRDIPGRKKILGREYTLTDEELDGIILERSNWEMTRQPGMKLSVNMILHATESVDLRRCPRYKALCSGPILPRKRRRCYNCQLTFRIFDKERPIEEISDAVSGIISSLQTKDSATRLSSSSQPCRGLTSSQDDDLLFKNIHFHREIPSLFRSEKVPCATAIKQLAIDELPPLHKAAATGNCSEIKRLLDQGCEIDMPLPFNAVLNSPSCPKWLPLHFEACTPLHIACWFGKLDAITVLLEKGANILAQVPTHKYETMTFALQGCELERIFWPVAERGARIEYQDIHGDTPLIIACASNKAFIVHYLLRHGALLETFDNYGATALQTAASNGHDRIFEILLDYGANPAPSHDIVPIHDMQWTTLHYAAAGGSVKILQFLLDDGQNPDAADSDGWSPFHLALANQHFEASVLLLDRTKNPNSRCKDGFSTLHSAAYASFTEIVEILIQCGADCNHKNGFGMTSLLSASVKDSQKLPDAQKSTVELLLRRGAFNNATDIHGSTPLHFAASFGNQIIAEILLKNGANIDAIDDQGGTPLHEAAYRGHSEIVKLLIEHGADIHLRDETGLTALHLSAQEGHCGILEVLLKHKAKPQATDLEGSTPLHRAAAMGFTSIVRVFLQVVVGVDVIHGLGRTAFHSAARWGRKDCMRLLLEHGADINTMAPIGCKARCPVNEYQLEVTGCAPLICASEHGFPEAVKLLLENGADIKAVRVDGKNALSCAVGFGNIEVVELLLGTGIAFDLPDVDGLTPLAYACRNQKDDIGKLLLKYGAAVDAQDCEGRTVLHWAALGGFESTAKILLENGAKLESDCIGRTPLHDAVFSGNMNLVKLLLENRADHHAKLSEHSTLGSWSKYTLKKATTDDDKKNTEDPSNEKVESATERNDDADNEVVTNALDIARSRGWTSIVDLLSF
ncbi:hypothetical protein ONS95_004242 [Cadophora gregata]|uniref:uncharacterized protein n=1 Tax=Cadophora gregata TaxID=51156 RepID=UPI0026DC3229|nr:uncharacterized protein ONS95_004242 [Cadophora gregata]KAK0105720.1 hypothetical protein ONS95_004242 [Cadophora gregata]